MPGNGDYVIFAKVKALVSLIYHIILDMERGEVYAAYGAAVLKQEGMSESSPLNH